MDIFADVLQDFFFAFSVCFDLTHSEEIAIALVLPAVNNFRFHFLLLRFFNYFNVHTVAAVIHKTVLKTDDPTVIIIRQESSGLHPVQNELFAKRNVVLVSAPRPLMPRKADFNRFGNVRQPSKVERHRLRILGLDFSARVPVPAASGNVLVCAR